MVFFKMTFFFFFASIERDCNLPNQIKFRIRRGKEIDIMSFCHFLPFNINDLAYTHSDLGVSSNLIS